MVVACAKKRSRRVRRGFTLVEVLLVCVLIGVMSAIAVPRFTGFLTRQRLEAATRRVQADLQAAQRLAQTQSKSCLVRFRQTTQSYTMPDLASSSSTTEIKLHEDPYGSTIAAVDFGGDGDLRFDGYGTPDSGGSITLAAGGYQKTITVDATTGKAAVP